MSLDVYLEAEVVRSEPKRRAIFIREFGTQREISREDWDKLNPGVEPVTCLVGGETSEIFHANITHNLNTMASAAGLYDLVWRPDEHNIVRAKELIKPLSEGLTRLIADPMKFKALNPDNGWGSYEGLIGFLADYLKACMDNPEALVKVWR